MEEVTKKYAVVTGANKGIGFGTCKLLASKGITVILTARDEKRGLEAVEELKEHGLSHNVVFHPLDVADLDSIAVLAEFIKTQFGKLDILVNNAGISGFEADSGTGNIIAAALQSDQPSRSKLMTIQTPQFGEKCLETNYYGAKRMCEALLPLLQLSDSPRIVNVSSVGGMLKFVSNEWAKAILSDVENLTEEKVDQVLNEYMKDFKEGSLEAKGWPTFLSAYSVSKAAMSAYTRILAKRNPHFCINCVHPGYVKTDITFNSGILTIEEGAESVVKLALLPNGGPSGLFFLEMEESEF
ncbi:Short-chain dehydrogenase/reductase SDR [Corchorus olitorius]|uniref:Short-chain dehydrogenase/reductase n=1 Tax=Corchorus olitorius TaxID=93759 RepID=A0A1R3K034_9ROSI|nr:Short-chain dehydrogenase/reductase SDR [Corchorus olitorius]